MSNCRVCQAETNGFMCKACFVRLERDLGDMRSLIEDVWVRAMGMANVYRANGRRRDTSDEVSVWGEEQNRIDARLRSREGRITLPSTRLMVDMDARTLLDDAWNTLVGWVRHLADSRGAELPSADYLCEWLVKNAEAIRFDEAAGEIHDEMTYLHGRLERAVDRSPSRVYAGPCHNPDCRVTSDSGDEVPRDLYARPNAEDITCDGYRSDYVGCGETYSFDERRQWLVEQVEHELVTVDAMLDALPHLFPELTVPKRHAVQSWIRDKRILPHGKDRVGEPTFVGGELLDLIRAYRPHKYASRSSRSQVA